MIQGRKKERQADLRKDTGSQEERRKEEVTRFIGFALLPKFHPLHLHFGGRTLPIFTVF